MLGHDFNSWGVETHRGWIPPLRRHAACSRLAGRRRRARAGGKESPFTVKEVGSKPDGGWPLVIAMHGGGGVPKKFNDSQWRHMQIYYKDHPEVGGYLYCALRAPTDEWNGFYTDYFYPVLEKLIRQFVVCDDVNPDRVIAIGYSHGGYGAFAIGPKMPHRFAAVHASASAPTGGQTAPDGLHSLRFSFMVGGKDTAYGRRERCEQFAQQLQAGRGGGVSRAQCTCTCPCACACAHARARCSCACAHAQDVEVVALVVMVVAILAR